MSRPVKYLTITYWTGARMSARSKFPSTVKLFNTAMYVK